jgi:hypothetical protein
MPSGGHQVEQSSFIELLYEIIDTVNESAAFGQSIDKSPETALIGPDAYIDSLQLLILIQAAEAKMSERFGVSLALLEDINLFDERGPLQSLGSFAAYLEKCTA